MRIPSFPTRSPSRGAALALGFVLAGCSGEATIELFPRTLSATGPPQSGGAGGEVPNQELDGGAAGAQPMPVGSDAGSSIGGSQATPMNSGGASPQGPGGAGASSGANGGDGGEAPPGGGGAAGAPVVIPDAGALDFLPVHRYRFDGNDDVAVDDVGGADGVVVGGATQDGSGAVVLDGNDDYVDLPNGIVSALGDATFSAWVTWNGNNCWHRIFSFGNTEQGEGIVGDASTELFVTPVNCAFAGQTTGITALFEVQGQASGGIWSEVQFDAELHHVALVFEDATPFMTLYLDGEAVGSGPTCCRLSDLVDENNWLGQSQWEQDFRFPGVYETFSIYAQALTPQQVATLFAAGPE